MEDLRFAEQVTSRLGQGKVHEVVLAKHWLLKDS